MYSYTHGQQSGNCYCEFSAKRPLRADKTAANVKPIILPPTAAMYIPVVWVDLDALLECRLTLATLLCVSKNRTENKALILQR